MLARQAFRRAAIFSLELERNVSAESARGAGRNQDRPEGAGRVIAERKVLLIGNIFAPDPNLDVVAVPGQGAIDQSIALGSNQLGFAIWPLVKIAGTDPGNV